MGSEAQEEVTKQAAKLPFLSTRPIMQSPERSGMSTPPLQTIASVPFRWEEEPGKPKTPSCKALSLPLNDFSQKSLELPPRLLMDTKVPSPRTVLEGPYGSRVKFQSSSFRMARECYSGGSTWSPERRHASAGALVLSKRWQKSHKEKGWLGSWGRKKLSFKGKREAVGGGSYVFPSLMDKENEGSRDDDGEEISNRTNVTLTRVARSGSFRVLSQAKSHIWTTIYKNLKEVVPWKRRKVKKNSRGDFIDQQSSTTG